MRLYIQNDNLTNGHDGGKDLAVTENMFFLYMIFVQYWIWSTADAGRK